MLRNLCFMRRVRPGRLDRRGAVILLLVWPCLDEAIELLCKVTLTIPVEGLDVQSVASIISDRQSTLDTIPFRLHF